MCGDLEKNVDGKPIMNYNKNGETVDWRGRWVNQNGYLVDKEGNILDQRGNRVFKKEILTSNGDLPKVFWMGLLWSDSASSLSKLLNDLGKTKGRIGNQSELANET